ncbi:MAG TPA: shikimate kinase [Gemmatimonadales bacterium]|nr:shikimate kinase [Gemmatimonadales bacterium]
MRRHVVLVGLPGSGKSTVGQLVAELLPAPLLDIDSILVRQMGMPIVQIFGMVGEPRFRSMERDAVRTARAREPAVIVPGGGWAAQPGEMQDARAGSLLIYLKCTPAVAVRRSEQGEVRPLVTGAADPVDRVKTLLASREPYYKLADYEVATDGKKAGDVAQEVVRLARVHGGW